jgi:hypothetical protein
MTDVGSGFGPRAGHVGSSLNLGRVAERAAPVEARPLCLLLLPCELEDFALRPHAEDLLGAPGVLAVDPPRLGRSARVPAPLADGLAAGAARRMKLPGFPRVVVIFGPLQYPLARGLIVAHEGAEIWYWRHAPLEQPASRRRRDRLEELHMAASFRSELIVVSTEALRDEVRGDDDARDPLLLELTDDPHADNRPLWERIEARGIESGRLGSERLA